MPGGRRGTRGYVSDDRTKYVAAQSNCYQYPGSAFQVSYRGPVANGGTCAGVMALAAAVFDTLG
jgi:hypothetical protein